MIFSGSPAGNHRRAASREANQPKIRRSEDAAKKRVSTGRLKNAEFKVSTSRIQGSMIWLRTA